MLLFAPVLSGRPDRQPPVATLLLCLLLLGIAAWSLPEMRRLECERSLISGGVLAAGPASEKQLDPSAQEPPGLRRAALGACLAALDARDPIRNWGYTRDGTAWHAVTAVFLHADWLHLAVNGIALLVLGACVERARGPFWTLGLFLGGGTAGMLLEGSLGPPGLLVGSSGAVAALLGACAVHYRSQPLRWRYAYLEALRVRRGSLEIPVALLVGMWLIQQLAGLLAPATAPGIAFVSHLGGFALGAAAAAAPRAPRIAA